MAYRLREQAKADIAAIWQYTAIHWGTKQADKYYRDIISCFEELAENPRLGIPRNEIKPGYRSFPQGSHIIFYVIDDTEIEIISIPHQREDFETRL